jgi:hypothetical protein
MPSNGLKQVLEMNLLPPRFIASEVASRRIDVLFSGRKV